LAAGASNHGGRGSNIGKARSNGTAIGFRIASQYFGWLSKAARSAIMGCGKSEKTTLYIAIMEFQDTPHICPFSRRSHAVSAGVRQ